MTMNEALILQKLESISSEIALLKSEIQTLKASQAPVVHADQPLAVALAKFEGQYKAEDLSHLLGNVLASVNEMNTMLAGAKAGTELFQDMGPIVRDGYPHIHRFFAELEDQFSVAELTGLLRNLLTNLNSFNEGIKLLRMAVELKDEMVPIAQIGYPKVLKFLNTLHEGEFQSEQLGTLLHTLLMNVHTFSDLMNMIKPMTELVKELTVVLRETDVISNTNVWLDSLQQSSGAIKLAGTAFASLKQFSINNQQADEISKAIGQLDFAHIKPVSPLAAAKYLFDPKVQEAMGAAFMVLQTVGSCLQAYQKNTNGKAPN